MQSTEGGLGLGLGLDLVLWEIWLGLGLVTGYSQWIVFSYIVPTMFDKFQL